MPPSRIALGSRGLLAVGAMAFAGCTVLFSPEAEEDDEDDVPLCVPPLSASAPSGQTFCPASTPPAGDGSWDGTFSVTQTIEGQGAPCRIAAADFDGDGDLDLAIAASEPVDAPARNLLLWEETDDRFVALEQAWDRRRVAAADVDCNGDVDLIGTSGGCGNGHLMVDYNGGPARFTNTTYDSICNASPFGAGDLDGDGLAEVIVGGGASRLRVHAGGDLATSCRIDVGLNYPDAVAVADFDGDGRADLAVSDDDKLIYAVGDGSAGFEELERSDPGGASTLVADVDSDGLDDLVVSRPDENEVVVYAGGPGFPPAAPRITVSENQPVGLALADFDGDGHLDLVSAGGGESAGTVLVFSGGGDGSFGPDPSASLEVGDDPRDVAAGDWNGDGALDIAVCSAGGGTVSVLAANRTAARQRSSLQPPK